MLDRLLALVTPRVVYAAVGLFVLAKLLQLAYKIYRMNRALRNVPVNPAFPLNFGCFQNMYGLERAAIFKKCGEAAKTIPESARKGCVQGLTKIYPLPFVPVTVITHFDPAETILKSSVHLNRNEMVNTLAEEVVGRSLFTYDKDTWKRKRKILAKTMHRDLHFGYGEEINRHMQKTILKMCQELDPKTGSKDFCYHTLQSDTSMHILADSFFGQELQGVQEAKDFIRIFDDNIQYLEMRMTNPILINKFIWDTYCYFKGIDFYKIRQDGFDVIFKMINRRKAVLDERRELECSSNNDSTGDASGKAKIKVIDVLLNLHHQGEISWEEVKAESMIFFTAALDTTAQAMIGGVYALSFDSEVTNAAQSKLIEEIDKFFPEKSDLENFQLEILDQMPYLDAVVKEAARYRTGSVIGRSANSEISFSNGFKVPATADHPIDITLDLRSVGDSFFVEKNGLDEKVLRTFDPERFLAKKYDSNTMGYQVFSKGPRDCIGKAFAYLSMKIQLIHLYRNFTTELVVTTEEDKTLDRVNVLNFSFQFKTPPIIKFIRREQ